MLPFDIDTLIDILKKNGFKEIVLQFIDEYLQYSVEVYGKLLEKLHHVNIYITADSTWGSSADDISAKHIQGDVLVYFGSDLSSSSTIPVIVVTELKDFNMTHFAPALSQALDTNKYYILFYEPSYYFAALRLSVGLSGTCHCAMLPKEADLEQWGNKTMNQSKDNVVCVGGLYVKEEWLGADNVEAIYIGDKDSQLEKIMIRLSTLQITHLSPKLNSVHKMMGSDCKTLRERYGGILKVKDASIIGIIIGSMGLSDSITKGIVSRLEKLITAANKKFYTFVMGRINEAKLCNFPEIEVFCLIANEDVSMIKPKSFPVPVITPFELELGLGARSWESILATSLDDLLRDDLEAAIERVKEENASYEDESDQDDLIDVSQLEGFAEDNMQIISLENLAGDGKMVVFNSAAAEYYNSRSYKGLEETIPTGHSTKIEQGHIGIAAGYRRVEKLDVTDVEDL